MDPSAVDTLALALNAAARIASALGAPGWVFIALVVGGVAVLGFRALPRLVGVKVEPAPPPISDGGTAAERDLPPAQPTSGEAGGGPTGGSG